LSTILRPRPFTPADRHVEIFKALCELLKPIGQARLERRKQRKQKIKANEQLPSSPTVITGFNEITRSLERKDPDDSDAIVFVCRSDTELPQLCSYYPQLCALAGRKLVQLQKGSEAALAGVLELKRVMGVQVKVRKRWKLPKKKNIIMALTLADTICSCSRRVLEIRGTV
jgi:hypothetical protein